MKQEEGRRKRRRRRQWVILEGGEKSFREEDRPLSSALTRPQHLHLFHTCMSKRDTMSSTERYHAPGRNGCMWSFLIWWIFVIWTRLGCLFTQDDVVTVVAVEEDAILSELMWDALS